MKRIIASVCLLYAANGCAMGPSKKLAAVVIGTMPVTVPVAYRSCYETEKQTALRTWLTDAGYPAGEIEYLVKKSDTIEQFLTGALLGAGPLMNIVILTEELRHSKENHYMTGFFEGLSLYATLPIAFKLLKKIK